MGRGTTRRGARWVGTRAAVAALVVVASVGLTAPARAHDVGGDEAAAEQHAETDLADRSVVEIERETRANARELPRSSATPPRRTAAATGLAVAADPGQSGRFGAVIGTPLLPVFQAVLPSGKVLMWDSVGDNATESYSDHTFTRAMVWNPADDSYRRVDVQGYNIFCAGYVQLPNGNVLVVGGNKNSALDGIRQTHLFDWRTETWSRGPDMTGERWYPAVAALANGEALIVGGGPGTAEIYQTDGRLRSLTGFTSFAARVYAFLTLRGDGRVEMVGPTRTMNTISTSGTGTLDATQTRDGINRDYGSFAPFGPDKTLVAGGGDLTEDGQTRVPTRTAVVVDTSGSTTTVTPTGSMAFPRRQFDLTVLPDGSVLATGGQRKSVDGLVDLDNPVLAAERYDPRTGSWTTLASAARIREYHSTSTLLPDGRVLTGGGGICGTCVSKGYLEKNVEYFSPPYLFARDGSGALATRPTVSAVPGSVQVGSTFTATSPQAGSIASMSLVRLGAPTHGIDQGQRFVPLSFSASGTTLRVTAPATTLAASPGYYMLFAVDRQGVPSVASMVQVVAANVAPVASAGADQTVAPGAVVTLDGTGSRDPEGSALTYRWTQTGGTAVTLSSATAARPSFTAPTSGAVTFGLVVSDGVRSSAPDSVTITVDATPTDLARGRTASQSSTYGSYSAGRAVDGNTDGVLSRGSVTQTGLNRYPWWQVDLGAGARPQQLTVWNRTDCCGSRLRDYWVFVSDTPFTTGLTPSQQASRATWSRHLTSAPSPSTTIQLPAGLAGRYVMVQQGRQYVSLSLAEVQVKGVR